MSKHLKVCENLAALALLKTERNLNLNCKIVKKKNNPTPRISLVVGWSVTFFTYPIQRYHICGLHVGDRLGDNVADMVVINVGHTA